MVFKSTFLAVLIICSIGYLFSQEGVMVSTKFRREYLPCTYDFLKKVSGTLKKFDCIAYCLDIMDCVTIKLIPTGNTFECILLSHGTQQFETPALEQNIKFYTKDACKQWIKIDHVNKDQTKETSYYFISQDYGTKNYASTKCNEFGPNVFLAEFENREKFDAVKTYMALEYPGNNKEYWIGLVYNTEQKAPQGNSNSYIWEQRQSQLSFFYWHTGAPTTDSKGLVEHCVRTRASYDFVLDNKQCDTGSNVYYICELL